MDNVWLSAGAIVVGSFLATLIWFNVIPQEWLPTYRPPLWSCLGVVVIGIVSLVRQWQRRRLR